MPGSTNVAREGGDDVQAVTRVHELRRTAGRFNNSARAGQSQSCARLFRTGALSGTVKTRTAVAYTSVSADRSIFTDRPSRGERDLNSDTPLHERIAATTLTHSEAQVAAFMAANPAMVAVSSTAELGSLTATSDATVVRTTKKLGYPSFRELRRSLTMSGRYRDPSKVLDDQLGQISSSSLGAKRVLTDTAELISQFEENLDMDSWNRAVSAMTSAARVVAYGIGPSGCVADYLSVLLKRSGVQSRSITATGLRLADDLLDISGNDVVLVFATMRRFREIDVVLNHASKAGATTILVSETLGITLRKHADIVLSTPPTTHSTSDGVLLGMVVARALELSVAAHDQASAVQSMERINALRADIVGGKLDIEG
jgi:DNA-binding MurR/RpiR family transcriptional regulator